MMKKTNKNHKKKSIPIYNVESSGEIASFDKLIDTVIKTLDKRDVHFDYYLPSKEHKELLNHICLYLSPVTLTKKYEDGSWGAEDIEQLNRLSQIIMVLLPVINKVDLTNMKKLMEEISSLIEELDGKNIQYTYPIIIEKLISLYETDHNYNYSLEILSTKLDIPKKIIENFFNSLAGREMLTLELKKKYNLAKKGRPFWEKVLKWNLGKELEIEDNNKKEKLRYLDELDYGEN